MKFAINKGSKSVILTVFIQDSSSTTGAGLGSLIHTSSIVGGYVRMGGTGVALAVDEDVTTEGTYQAPSAVGKVRIGTPANMRTGTYELHFHDDLWAHGARSVTITLGGATNMAPLNLEVQLVDDPGLVLVDTTIAALTDQQNFTLTDGSADNDAYNGCAIVVEDATTGAQRACGFISDYVGSTKAVVLAADPGVFTMAAGDHVRVLSRVAVDLARVEGAAPTPGFPSVDVGSVGGSTAAAARMALLAASITPGTVSNAVSTPTTTNIPADDVTEATADHFKDQVLKFTTGANAGQARRITGYSLVSSEGVFVTDAFTDAPANNDEFIVI